MSWQQIVMIVWLSWVVLIGLLSHGTPRTGKNNFFISLFSSAIMAAILYTGGFWG